MAATVATTRTVLARALEVALDRYSYWLSTAIATNACACRTIRMDPQPRPAELNPDLVEMIIAQANAQAVVWDRWEYSTPTTVYY